MDSQIVQTIIDGIADLVANKVSERINAQPQEHSTLMTTDELATYLRVPKTWLYDRTRDNTIPHVKVGKYVRFSLPDILAWLKTSTDRDLIG